MKMPQQISADSLEDENVWLSGSSDAESIAEESTQNEVVSEHGDQTAVTADNSKKRPLTTGFAVGAPAKKQQKTSKNGTIKTASKVEKKDPNHNAIKELRNERDIADFLWNNIILESALKSGLLQNKKLFKLKLEEMCKSSGLTELELNDLEKYRPPADRIFVPPSFQVTASLDNAAKLYEKYRELHKVKSKCKSRKASVAVLVVCPGAVRATDVIRAFKPTLKYGKISKLFAKHMKIEEQEEFIQKNIVEIAVGTPNRILKFMQDQPSMFAHLDLIIMDSFIDVKNRSTFDMPECRKDFIDMLSLIKNRGKCSPKFALF